MDVLPPIWRRTREAVATMAWRPGDHAWPWAQRPPSGRAYHPPEKAISRLRSGRLSHVVLPPIVAHNTAAGDHQSGCRKGAQILQGIAMYGEKIRGLSGCQNAQVVATQGLRGD